MIEIPIEVLNAQLGEIEKVHEKAMEESKLLDAVERERNQILLLITEQENGVQGSSNLDPLLSKKFRTRAGYSSIRLEKLLLDLDKVDTMGSQDIRARRKEEVKFLQSLLSRSDDMNQKATSLVDLQERLAAGGETASKNTLVPSEVNSSVKEQPVPQSPSTRNDAARALRKRSLEQAPQVSPKEDRISELEDVGDDKEAFRMEVEEKPSSPSSSSDGGDSLPITQNDSVEDLQAAQDEMDRRAEEYYRSIHEAQEAKRCSSKPQEDKDESENEAKPEKHTSKTNKQQTSRQQYQRKHEESELSQPNVAIQEVARAYVMLVQDAKAHRARVSIDSEGILSISVLGRAPAKYALGSNVNTNAVTKELLPNNVLRIILPKAYACPMRTGRPSFADVSPFWGLHRDDLWSRF